MTGEYSFYTWNLKDFWTADTGTDRYAAVVDVIRQLDATVIAVQEVIAADQATAMARLAELTGMTATVSAGSSGEAAADRPVYAEGSGGNRFVTGPAVVARFCCHRAPGQLPGLRRQRTSSTR
jgi:endonuclease/exonuclease/phosphatase family metal-dependent hydrolase